MVRTLRLGPGERRKLDQPAEVEDSAAVPPTPPEVSSLRRCWAELLRRVDEIDPLLCPKCGSQMKAIAFITEPQVIRGILDHLKKKARNKRAPPVPAADRDDD